jgi:hypothetical protein
MNMEREEKNIPLMKSIFSLGLIVIVFLTCGCLSNNGEGEIDDHQERISSPAIITAKGSISSNNTISNLELYMNLYGNEGYDMRNIVIRLNATPSDGITVTGNVTLDTTGTADADSFTVDEIIDPLDVWDPTGTPASFILSQGAQLKINIDLELAVIALPPDSELQIILYDTASLNEEIDLLRTPRSYPKEGKISLED